MSEEYILKTYALSKRKEHAFVDSLTDEKIRIFCGNDAFASTKKQAASSTSPDKMSKKNR